MQQLLCNLWREEDGQDLVEYSLLIAFIAIATAALVATPQSSIRGIWSTSNSTIQWANSAH